MGMKRAMSGSWHEGSTSRASSGGLAPADARRRSSIERLHVPGARRDQPRGPAPRQLLERERVAAGVKAHEAGDRDVLQEVDSSERLACRRIREVYLHERTLHCQQGIPEADRRVREPGCVHDRGVEIAQVEPIDERPLVVRLEEGDRHVELNGPCGDPGVDLAERFAPVDGRLPGSQQVEVRAVEHEHAKGPPRARATHARLTHALTPLCGAAMPAGSTLPTAPAGVPDNTLRAAASTTSAGMSARTVQPPAVASTHGSRPPCCFLSVATASSTAPTEWGSVVLPSSSRSRSISTRPARSGGVTPTATPIRSAARSPYATASPCRIPRNPATVSIACASECPRFNEIRPPCSRSSAVTTSILAAAQRSTSSAIAPDAKTAGSPAARAGPSASRSSRSRSTPSAPIFTASPSAPRSSRGSSVRRTLTSVMFAAAW